MMQNPTTAGETDVERALEQGGEPGLKWKSGEHVDASQPRGFAEYAKTHVELRSALPTSQRDSDRIYSVFPCSGGGKMKMQRCAAQLKNADARICEEPTGHFDVDITDGVEGRRWAQVGCDLTRTGRGVLVGVEERRVR